MKALNSVDVGYYDYEDIGIAADEINRFNQLSDKKRSILKELGFTEKDAKTLCDRYALLSPHYETSKRDGCALCPHAKREERVRLFSEYPEAYQIVFELQNFVKTNRPDQTPLRNYKWFIEDDGSIN